VIVCADQASEWICSGACLLTAGCSRALSVSEHQIRRANSGGLLPVTPLVVLDPMHLFVLRHLVAVRPDRMGVSMSGRPGTATSLSFCAVRAANPVSGEAESRLTVSGA